MTWEKIMKAAAEAGFIVHAYGGTAVLATHENQKEAGIFEETQYKCGHGKHPKTIAQKN